MSPRNVGDRFAAGSARLVERLATDPELELAIDRGVLQRGERVVQIYWVRIRGKSQAEARKALWLLLGTLFEHSRQLQRAALERVTRVMHPVLPAVLRDCTQPLIVGHLFGGFLLDRRPDHSLDVPLRHAFRFPELPLQLLEMCVRASAAQFRRNRREQSESSPPVLFVSGAGALIGRDVAQNHGLQPLAIPGSAVRG